MLMLLYIIIATVIVSLISLVGLFLVSDKIKKYVHYLISFSAATLLAVAFFGLLPTSLEHFADAGIDIHEGLLYVFIGVLLFFFMERVIHWHHCDTCIKEGHEHEATAMMILVGDFIHNFVDGIMIAGAFLLDVRAGVITTFSIIAHEIPQEVGDFSVLIHSGYSKFKALLFNFYSSLSAILGGVLGYFAFTAVEGIVPYATAIAGGGFIYVSLSHIVPALHEHKQSKHIIFIETVIFMVTLILFYLLLSSHSH